LHDNLLSGRGISYHKFCEKFWQYKINGDFYFLLTEVKCMTKNNQTQAMNQTSRDETASVIASIFHLTPRAVRMVIQGETINEPVLEAVMYYKEGKSKLIQEIEKLVPIEKKQSI
jgi:hypothetical protein